MAKKQRNKRVGAAVVPKRRKRVGAAVVPKPVEEQPPARSAGVISPDNMRNLTRLLPFKPYTEIYYSFTFSISRYRYLCPFAAGYIRDNPYKTALFVTLTASAIYFYPIIVASSYASLCETAIEIAKVIIQYDTIPRLTNKLSSHLRNKYACNPNYHQKGNFAKIISRLGDISKHNIGLIFDVIPALSIYHTTATKLFKTNDYSMYTYESICATVLFNGFFAYLFKTKHLDAVNNIKELSNANANIHQATRSREYLNDFQEHNPQEIVERMNHLDSSNTNLQSSLKLAIVLPKLITKICKELFPLNNSLADAVDIFLSCSVASYAILSHYFDPKAYYAHVKIDKIIMASQEQVPENPGLGIGAN